MSDTMTSVMSPNLRERCAVSEEPQPRVRAVLLMPEEIRIALKWAANDAGIDMGEFVVEALGNDPRFVEAMERYRRKQAGDKKRK